MNKKKIAALMLAGITALSALALSGCGSAESDGTSTSTAKESQNGETTESTEVYTPTFMYFVSESDAEYATEMAVVNELKAEYGDKVNFDIHNIDETPEDKENFPVDGQTPFLIMLDTSNNISKMEMQCLDKDTLKADIENALSGNTGE